MIMHVDINCDMGELMPGMLTNVDEVFMPYISSCNISCGAHSGNPEIIKSTIQSAIQNKISLGAHPSYPDRENAGRKSINISDSELETQLSYQLHALQEMVVSMGGNIYHVKAHGALYNDIAFDKNKASIFVNVVKAINPLWKIYGLSMAPLRYVCEALEMEYVSEVFADRRYESDLRLRSRMHEDALLSNQGEVEDQLSQFVQNKVKTSEAIKNIDVQSICIHSDTPNALEIAKKTNLYLKENNIEICKI